MDPDQKQDKILEMLYGIVPVVTSIKSELSEVIQRLGKAEIAIGQGIVFSETNIKDIDALGRKMRDHTTDSLSHNGRAVQESRFTWQTALSIAALSVAAAAIYARH